MMKKNKNVLLMSDDSSDEPDDEVTEIKRAMVSRESYYAILFDPEMFSTREKRERGKSLSHQSSKYNGKKTTARKMNSKK